MINHLNHSIKDLDIYFFILRIFSFIYILFSIFNMKLDKIEIYKEKLLKKKGNIEISEKLKKEHYMKDLIMMKMQELLQMKILY